MTLRMVAVAGCLALLSACGGVSRHCMGELEYQSAQTLPAPGNIEGLTLRDSASALRIPPEPADPVPFARRVPDPEEPGKSRIECLDVPPRLDIAPEPELEPESVPEAAPEAATEAKS